MDQYMHQILKSRNFPKKISVQTKGKKTRHEIKLFMGKKGAENDGKLQFFRKKLPKFR
jgi:hypothetical protein